MEYRQKTKPNLKQPAWNSASKSGTWRGWCLKYVDDSIKAPARQPNAMATWRVESKGNTRTGLPPLEVWTPIFFSFATGAHKNNGHVAWAYRRRDGSIDIVDTEVHSGARRNYNSIEELLAWFSAYKPKYLGWSLWCDGVHVVEEYEQPKPPVKPPVEPPKPPVVIPADLKVGDTLVLEVKEIRKK